MPPGGNRFGKADEQALVITPPTSGGTAQIPFSATSTIIKIPDAWLNKWLSLCSMKADAYIITGPTSAPLAALTNFFTDTVIDGATKALTLSNNTPFPCPQSAILPYYFDAQLHAFMLVVGIDAGKLYVAPSSPNAGGT